MRHKKEHKESHPEIKHQEMHPRTRKMLERHHQKIEKMVHETKKHLGIHTEGEVMKVRDRHASRAMENGIREKRKYTKRK